MFLELIHEPSPKITPPWEQQVLHISQSSFPFLISGAFPMVKKKTLVIFCLMKNRGKFQK